MINNQISLIMGMCSIKLHILSAMMILCISYIPVVKGQAGAQPSFNERPLGKTEGCFNTFPDLLNIDFSATDILTNAKCQSLCADHGFVVAATSYRTCYCGNIYPAIYYEVDGRRCNQPCSLDRTTCTLSACCGDKIGKYFTVSFAGEIEPRLELLRRLVFDYRENSPIFRAYIESMMAKTTALQALRSGPSPAMMASAASTLGNTSTPASMAGNTAFVGLGEGCPTGWQTSGDSCYMAVVGGPPTTYDDTQTSCVNAGGTLASVTSLEQNKAVKRLLQGQTGWLGLIAQPMVSGYTWNWDSYSSWDTNQPDRTSFATRSPDVYGPVSGGAFDDYTRNIVGIAALTVGYGFGAILSLNATYHLENGSTWASPLRGAPSVRTVATLTLAPGERITKVEGVTNSRTFQGITITVTGAARNTRIWGPFGTAPGIKPTFSYVPSSEVIALYGRSSEKALFQLGFYEYLGKACTQVNDLGLWEAIYCDDRVPTPYYLCESPQPETRLQCPTGWINFGQSCFKVFQGDTSMSWKEASDSCNANGGWLATLDSSAKRDAAWALMQEAVGFIGMRNAQASSQNPLWGWSYYDNWGLNQPAPILDSNGNFDPASTCVQMMADGTWQTVQCSAVQQAVVPICQVAVLDEVCTCPDGWIAMDCSCYGIGQGTAGGLIQSSWIDMHNFCSSWISGGRLPLPQTQNQTMALRQWAKKAYPTATVFLALRDTFGAGAIRPEIFVAWGGGQQPLPTYNLCGSMRSDGNWYGLDCSSSKLKSFVCRLPRAATAAFVGGEGQSFNISLTPGQDIRWGSPLEVEITQSDAGAHLAVDKDGNVFPVKNDTSIASGRRLQQSQTDISTRFTFTMAGDGAVGAFVLASPNHGSYIYSDPSTGALKGVTPPPSNSTPEPLDLVKNGYATLFTASQAVPALAIQNLQISFIAKGYGDTKPVLCTMYVYDLTPESTSYKCFEVEGSTEGMPIVSLDMSAWANQDTASVLSARVPLDLGRLVCENSSPDQSSTCAATYGQALLVSTIMNILNGYTLQNTYQISYGADQTNFWNLAQYVTNTYTDITQVTYISTNQYSANIPVPPSTTITVQFWQSTVTLNYIWSSLFSAVGSFQLSSLGIKLDVPRSLTTVSSTQDLLFYVWGRFYYPTQGELIILSDTAEFGTFPFDRPPLSNIPS